MSPWICHFPGLSENYNTRKEETVVPKIQKLITIFIRINFSKCDNEDVAISSISTETANRSECGQDEPQK